MKSTGVITGVAAVVSALAAPDVAPTVKVGSAKYQGVHNATSGINAYYGVKYAKAPIQNLRWKPPVPLDPRSISGDFMNATTRGPACIQTSPPWQPSGGSALVQSEDCLLLDILTPEKVVGKLPVMVNIHGGGYVGGSALQGDSMVYHSNGSMIYVAIQYRLGPLGFLAGDEVAKDGSWNVGLLDQRAALEWIREYIHHFGGDPEKVTITGGSAGGGSVTMQMILHGGEKHPPFRAAIPEYPWMTPMYSASWFNQQYKGLLSASNCTDLACLRNLPIGAFETATSLATRTAYNNSKFSYGTFYWGPAVDGKNIRDYPVNEIQNGHFTKVPVLVDRDGYEGFFFINASTKSEEEVVSTLEALWQDGDRAFVGQVLEQYPVEQFNASLLEGLKALPTLTGPNFTLSDSFGRLQDIVGDALIDCPTNYIAAAFAEAGLIAYKMVFNAGSQFHGATTAFLYSPLINPIGAGSIPAAYPNATLATYMRDYFVSFTLHLDPNKYAYRNQPPNWPRFTTGRSEVLRVEFDSIGVSVDPEKSPQCAFLEAAPGQFTGI